MSHKIFFASLFVVMVGCGGDASFSVAKHSLSVKDQGFTYISMGTFCEQLAANQLMITISDYKPTCGGPVQDGGSATKAHSKLDITIGLAGHDNRSIPFTIGNTNCITGQNAANGIAAFTYSPASGDPEITHATSGSVTLNKEWTPDSAAIGTFDLTFEDQSHIKGDFNATNCH